MWDQSERRNVKSCLEKYDCLSLPTDHQYHGWCLELSEPTARTNGVHQSVVAGSQISRLGFSRYKTLGLQVIRDRKLYDVEQRRILYELGISIEK